MNKRLYTDLRREIRRSLPRFLSILLMVALGVMFLVGLRSAAPDMRATADAYFDERGFFDLQLFSTLGLAQGDLKTLAELPGVEAVAGGVVLDGTLLSGSQERVVKLHSLSPGFNLPRVTEGRLPEQAGECALDARLRGSLRLGSRVKLNAATEDALAGEDYTVVGFAESPLYISIDRGTSSLGDGSVAGFVLLPEAGFALDYATVAYLRAEGAAALDAYGSDYEALTQALRDRAEPLLATLAAERYELLKTDGARQLSQGERELAETWADAREQLREAEDKLRQGRETLDRGKEALEQGRADYEAGLQSGREALDSARKELEAGREALTKGALELSVGRAALALRRSLYETELRTAQEQTAQAEQTLARRREALTQAQSRAEATRQAAVDYEACLEAQLPALLLPGQKPDPAYTLEGLTQKLFEASLAEALAQAAERDLSAAQESLARSRSDLDKTRREGAASVAALEGQLAKGEADYEAAQARLEAGEAALAQGEADYENQKAAGAEALEAAEAELAARETEYQEGLAALETARTEAETARREAREKLDRAAEALEALAPAETYVLDRHSNYGFVSYDQNAQRMANLAKMFPVIFYLVAALVCLTTMTRMVEEDRTQIGAIKALGYGTGTIAGKYLLYGALAALLGAVLGAAVGSVVIPWVIFSSYQIMYVLPELKLRIYWPLCLLAAGAGLAVTLGATTWAMASTARQTPAALLRPKAPKPGKRILLERVEPLWRRMSFSMKVSARNLFRYKKRLFMTVIGVAGCTALLIAGLGLHSSIFDILDVQFFDLYRYDVQLTLDPESRGVTERVDALLAERGAVWTGIYNRSVSFSAAGKTVEGYLTVTDDPRALAEQIRLRDMDSKEPLSVPAEGALIDLKLSELLALEPGDALSVDLGRPSTLEVSAVREHYVYHYAILTADSYAALTGERPAVNEYLISLPEGGEEEISELCAALMRVEGVRGAQNKNAMARDFRKTMEVVDAAVMVIVLSAAALAFVVLYNLTNINLTERVRELATIKVLGFYDPEVAMYIYRENIVLTVMGIALGQLLGKYLCAFLIRTIEMDIVMFGRDPQPENYLLSVVLSLLFAALVNLLMYFRMKKIDMVQALKSVE